MTKTRASLILADVPLYGDKHRGDLIADADPDGRPVQHFRIRDQWPLDRMQASGAIDVDQYEAGRRFRDVFDRAQLHGLKASDPQRPSVAADRGSSAARAGLGLLPAEAMLAARESVARALGAVGPLGGSVLWHVVGAGASVRDWVGLQRGAGVPMSADRALGVLSASLSTLAAHYGLTRPRAMPGVPGRAAGAGR